MIHLRNLYVLWLLTLIGGGEYLGASNLINIKPKQDFSVVSFKVVQVRGNVTYAKPLSLEFGSVKMNQRISDGSILRVEPDSSVMFEADDNLGREGLSVKKTRITINIPIIVRLGRDSFRKIKVDPRALSQFDSKIRRNIGDAESLFRKMADAWKEAAAILNPDSSMDEETLRQIVAALNKTGAKDDVSISVAHGKIDFVTPAENQVLITDKVPTDLKIQWRREGAPADDVEKYDLFFWKQGEPKTPYARSHGNKYSVSVSGTGTYYMQVQTPDGAYKSKLRAVEVKLKKEAMKDKAHYSDLGRQEAIKAALNRRIKSLSPDRNLFWYGKGDWPIFGFEWSRPEICSENVVYEFIVNDKNKKQVYKKTLNTQELQWRPPQGFFGQLFWEARVIGCMGFGKKIVELDVNTIPRKIELARDDDDSSSLRKISAARFNGTLFFDSF